MSAYGNKIERIRWLDEDSYRIGLLFSDGFAAAIDLSSVFSEPKALAAEILRGGMFSMCFLESGALAWPNGLELCPDSLRASAVPDHRSAVA
jgi:hypothetical protein